MLALREKKYDFFRKMTLLHENIVETACILLYYCKEKRDFFNKIMLRLIKKARFCQENDTFTGKKSVICWNK